jgi:hypothetical protein
VDRARADLLADPLQAVRARFHLIPGRMQGMAHELGEVLPLPALGAVSRSGHKSRSNAERRAAMPRAVWLFTAPRLIFIVAAISASDRSA